MGVAQVQRRLGHASVVSTMLYTHLHVDDVRVALDEVFTPAAAPRPSSVKGRRSQSLVPGSGFVDENGFEERGGPHQNAISPVGRLDEVEGVRHLRDPT